MTDKQLRQLRNHPKKGDMITVDPLRSLEDVAKVKAVLGDDPRNLAIFIVGVNTGFRASDLCNLLARDVKNLKPGDEFTVRMKKTGQKITIFWNKACYKAVQELLALYEYEDDTPLFFSFNTGEKLLVSTLSNLVKIWCFRAGIKGNYASHSLRKTFGYLHRVVFKTDRDVICKLLGHRTYESLDAYLGIQAEEKKTAFLKEI